MTAPLAVRRGAPVTQPSLAAVGIAEPAFELNARFDPRTGSTGNWLGGDCAASVPLGDGRILWLFNDSFKGAGAGPWTNRLGSQFVNDSFAIQAGPDLATAPLTFLFAPGGGNWLPMPTGYYAWAEGAIVLDGHLFITSKRIQASAGGDFDAGWCVHKIPNVLTVNPAAWVPVLLYQSGNTDTRPVLSLYEDAGYIYAFGLKLRNGWRWARWTRADFVAGLHGNVQWNQIFSWVSDSANAWQIAEAFFAADGSVHKRPDGRWVMVESGSAYPKSLVQARVCEGPTFLPGNSYYPLPPAFQVGDRVADTATSQTGTITAGFETQRNVKLDVVWGGATITRSTTQLTALTGTHRGIYAPPENYVADSQNYAAKAHPELSGGPGLICSYVDNRPNLDGANQPIPNGLAYDLGTYWPKFLRVKPPTISALAAVGGTASWTITGQIDRLLLKVGAGAWTELSPTATSAPVTGSPVSLRAIGIGGDTTVTT